ncbi:hypothetical protein CROQUDRAFT_719289 [Cronartium quercuum f. sp. fusiforme G11]|uniref:Uncharacterized protein n=1 Tax=Cronartium quercuum f. sp. fusiforme G11 TaxID=708437 RepID=A0A9P6NYK3_9BASI|nr:hypothetical protein CROQUDRAFT_719289 [Cronartium quercuum f. sp. fusiforme G11]
MTVPIPIFTGAIHDSWDLHEVRLLCWLKAQNIPEKEDETRMDYLLLSLKPNSNPLNWFTVQPHELRSNFVQSLDLLKNKYGNELRKEMLRLSALNTLEVRTFRDAEHKSEMVYELINDIENLLSLGGVQNDSHKRDYLLRCFRAFSGALKMMNRSTSYDGAVLASLNWEASVISKLVPSNAP